MGYFLRQGILDRQTVVPIDQARYELLAQARKTLVDAGSFEDRYELLLGNFVAFEMYCAELSLRNNIEFDYRYEKTAAVFTDANRLAINFLTTTRQYVDQVVQDFKHLAITVPYSEQATRLKQQAYDTTPAYRFVEALRNHVQHRAIAIHGSKGSDAYNEWFEGTMLYCKKKYLAEDEKFKKSVLDELADEIDLLAMFRGYMAAVSSIQSELRKLIAQECKDARAAVEQAQADYIKAQKPERGMAHKTSVPALTACKGEEDVYTDAVIMMLDWDDARVLLANKNAVRIRMPR